MKALIGAMLMMSTGCTAAPPAEAEAPVHGGGGNCNAAPAQKLVGRARSQAVGAEARRLSGAAALRWIPEGTMVTMDYREDRVNLRVDSKDRLIKVDCG